MDVRRAASFEKGKQDGKGVSERKGTGNRIQLTSRKILEKVRADYILIIISLLVDISGKMPATPTAMVAVREGVRYPALFYLVIVSDFVQDYSVCERWCMPVRKLL